MYSEKLKEYLPSYIFSSESFSELFKAEGKELNSLESMKKDIDKQFDIDTCTWALDIYEKELGISTDYIKDIDYRRSVVKSKWRGSGKLDAALIKIVCDAFTNGDVEIIFDGKIYVKFRSVKGIPSNLNDLKEAVNKVKPAYLLLDYLFSYLLVRDINHMLTINQLQNTKLNMFAGGEQIGR